MTRHICTLSIFLALVGALVGCGQRAAGNNSSDRLPQNLLVQARPMVADMRIGDWTCAGATASDSGVVFISRRSEVSHDCTWSSFTIVRKEDGYHVYVHRSMHVLPGDSSDAEYVRLGYIRAVKVWWSK